MTDIIMILAIIVGPIAAVQVQKWLEKKRDNTQRKLFIFKTLMTTRATKVSIEHVQALNMIDVEFTKGYESVITAWRNYHDHLSNGDPKSDVWGERNNDLFIEMLSEMARSLGYNKFDKVMLRRTAYSPVAHGNQEFELQTIRKGLADILSGNATLPVYFANEELHPNEEPQASSQIA
jgi:hypothetical protein